MHKITEGLFTPVKPIAGPGLRLLGDAYSELNKKERGGGTIQEGRYLLREGSDILPGVSFPLWLSLREHGQDTGRNRHVQGSSRIGIPVRPGETILTNTWPGWE